MFVCAYVQRSLSKDHNLQISFKGVQSGNQSTASTGAWDHAEIEPSNRRGLMFTKGGGGDYE